MLDSKTFQRVGHDLEQRGLVVAPKNDPGVPGELDILAHSCCSKSVGTWSLCSHSVRRRASGVTVVHNQDGQGALHVFIADLISLEEPSIRQECVIHVDDRNTPLAPVAS